MKRNKLVIIRGSSSTAGPVTRFYFNTELEDSLRKFSEQYTYGSSEVLYFDDELSVKGSDPFLKITVVN